VFRVDGRQRERPGKLDAKVTYADEFSLAEAWASETRGEHAMRKAERSIVSGASAVVALAFIVGCGPRVRVTPDPAAGLTPRDDGECDARVLREQDPVEPGMVEVGDVFVGDSGFTVNCGRARMTEELRRQACRYGADAVRITLTHQPDFNSTCIRFDAKLLKRSAAKGGEVQ
jgi:hypothetical protein